jgi:Family of unknown function (DUF5681)
LPVDGPKDYKIGFGKPPAATRFKTADRADPRGRPSGSKSLAAVLRRALDAPVTGGDGKRRRLSKRELMIHALVERSAEGDLAATKLLFEMLRRADPQALGPDPHESAPFGGDALAQLKERLTRLARAQMADASHPPEPSDPAPSASQRVSTVRKAVIDGMKK